MNSCWLGLVGHHSFPRGDPGKAAKVAPAGVGDGNVAKARPPLKHQMKHLFDVHGQRRLRKHLGNPKFTALGERLEKIKERHEQGLLTSLEFLKQILELAEEVVEAEKETDQKVDPQRGSLKIWTLGL